MEGVDHVHVVQIGGGSLIGQVHRVIQRQVPDGEGFKLGVTGLVAPAVLVVQLAQAGGQLAAAGAGGRNHHQAAGGFNVVVLAQALVADDQVQVGGVAVNQVMAVGAHAQAGQMLLKGHGRGLALELGEHHAAHIQPVAAEHVDQTQHILLIPDAQIAPGLGLFNVARIDGDDDLGLILHLKQHPHLAVRLKARQHTAGVVIVKEFAAELQIQLAAELLNALADLLRLGEQILVVVKTDLIHETFPPMDGRWGRPVLTPKNCPP